MLVSTQHNSNDKLVTTYDLMEDERLLLKHLGVWDDFLGLVKPDEKITVNGKEVDSHGNY